MSEPLLGIPQPGNPSERRLDSWKEIATYLGRDVTTVQRWEKREGMPVHRHLHDKRGSVYALTSELDAWRQSRRRLEEEGTEEGKQEDQESQGEAPVLAESDSQPVAAPRSARWFALAGLAVFLALAGAYIIRSRGDQAARPKIKSLAVLPWKNLSGDPSQEYLADGMTEELIGRLSRIHDLRVTSRTSVMSFKNPQLSVPEIARALGVDALVEGSIRREGDRIRVTAQLIRGATDEHFWSETYDRELRDALTLQSELAQSIAEKVEVTVTGQELKRLAATRSIAPEVYESYLKGQFLASNVHSKASLEESVGYFNDALKKDPTFAPAYLGLAQASNGLGTVFIGAPPNEMRLRVLEAARKALELDPDLAEAHVLLASVEQEQFHWADAENEFKRALELSPNDARAHAGYASWLLCQGRTDEALAWVRRGRELDPVAVSGVDIAWILFAARRYDEATQELRSALAVWPNDVNVLWNLGFVLMASGHSGEAIPALERTLALSDRSPGALGLLIRAYAQAGRRPEAIGLLNELKRRHQTGYVPAGAFVHAYLGLGDNEQAFVWLEKAYQEQSNLLQFLKVHPFFDPLRKDPRFADLLRRVGLGQP